MINVDVVVDHLPWNKRLKKNKLFFNKIIKFFPKKYQFKKRKILITLFLSNNKSIKKLNFKFRNKNKPTDILSSPLNQKIGKKFYLDDIIISYQYMDKSKKITNLDFKKKLIKIFIHGFLHLIGYDHKMNKDYKKMYNEEVKIFNLIENKVDKIN